MNGRYILVDGKPVREPDLLKWAQFMEDNDARMVAEYSVPGVRVSTVFLGLDHSFGRGGEPLLWETMIFGGKHDQYQERYTSRLEAEIGHGKAVKLATEIGGQP